MSKPNANWDIRAKVKTFDYDTEFTRNDIHTWSEDSTDRIDEVIRLLVKTTTLKYNGHRNGVGDDVYYQRARVLDDKIKKLRSAADELEDIRHVRSVYTDLDIEIDRWKHERFKSASVNSLVTDFDSGNSCGCCSDSAMYVRPYIIVKCPSGSEVRVHSDPPQFTVGSNNSYGPPDIYEYASAMREKNISAAVITKLEKIYKPNE